MNLLAYVVSYGQLMGEPCKSALYRGRLYKIVISESAHFIWALRCERRITKEDDAPAYGEDEVRNKWIHRMNTRLTLDRHTTDRKRYKSKAVKPATVLNTWGGTLSDEANLPDDWTRQSGVLVGIRARRPPGRNR